MHRHDQARDARHFDSYGAKPVARDVIFHHEPGHVPEAEAGAQKRVLRAHVRKPPGVLRIDAVVLTLRKVRAIGQHELHVLLEFGFGDDAFVRGQRMHRSDDGGLSWFEITDGLPSEFGFAAAAHPHDRDSFYVIPLDPGHARCMPEGSAAVWRTRDGGESWRRLDRGLPQRDAHLGVLRAAMAIDAGEVPGLYFGTSTGQVFASVDEGESWSEIASYLPPVWSVEVAVIE